MERVVEMEPDYVDGLAWLSYLYVDEFHHRWNEPDGEYDSRQRALEVAERAVSLDDGNQLAHGYLGMAAFYLGDSNRGINEMLRAVDLNPNNPHVLVLLANNLANQGEMERAVSIAERAIALSPHPPEWSFWPMFVDLYWHGRYEEALVYSRSGLAGEDDFREPLYVAATLGQLGRTEEASSALTELRVRWDERCAQADCGVLGIDTLRRELIERHAISASITDRLLEGVVKAGLKRPAVASLRIAVLPFVNASGDSEQRYFSDGLTSEIVTELYRYDELAVISCREGPCGRGDADSNTIGRELGVRYVLHGSVQTSRDRIRVNAQLSDARGGRSVWAETFNSRRTASDLFDLQDALTRQVVNAIAGSHGVLARVDLRSSKRKPPASMNSYDCVLRVYGFWHEHTAESLREARNCLERVRAAEPDYVEGLAWLALLYADQQYHYWDEPGQGYDSRERAVELGERAVSLDGGNPRARAHLGFALFRSGDPERGIAEMTRAVELNPNNPDLLDILGGSLVKTGEFERAVAITKRAIELNPDPPEWIDLPLFIDHYVHGRYEQALVRSRNGLVAIEDFREPLYLAATLGQLGRREEAAPVLDEFRAQWARLCEQTGCEDLDIDDVRQELTEHHHFSESITGKLIEGLAKAGVKEEKPTGGG
jgi:adenylate cyclase